jgi:hypothetical protein
MCLPRFRTGICAFLLFAVIPITRAQQHSPTGIDKIDHVVFIIKENRSFDNMFGTLNSTYGTKMCAWLVALARANSASTSEGCLDRHLGSSRCHRRSASSGARFWMAATDGHHLHPSNAMSSFRRSSSAVDHHDKMCSLTSAPGVGLQYLWGIGGCCGTTRPMRFSWNLYECPDSTVAIVHSFPFGAVALMSSGRDSGRKRKENAPSRSAGLIFISLAVT